MFGRIVRATRRRHGLTQEELADRTGLSVRTISKLETGRIGTPRPATVRLLADAFGLTGAEREDFYRSAAAEITEPAGSDVAAPEAAVRELVTVPRQLPAGPTRFVGRRRELERLVALAEDAEGFDGPALAVIDGMGGIGKTALAVQAARLIADRFPGGQLFIDLKGFTHGSEPVDPAAALERLLLAVGVPGQRRLSELADGPRSVAVVLEASYRRLTAEQQRMYQLLGLHPGPDFDRYAAAALADTTPDRAGRLLDQLLDERLLLEPAPGRYTFHDLVREHAVATATGTGAAGKAAVDRLLDYYRHAAAVAARTAYPAERHGRLHVPPSPVCGPEPPDAAAARDWLDVEFPNLLAAAGYAATHDRLTHLLHFSRVLHRPLYARGRCRDGEQLHQRALAAARATGDRAGEAAVISCLAHMQRIQGRLTEAGTSYREAVRLAVAAGDPVAEVDALNGLGQVHRLQGRYAEAFEVFERALQLARAADDRLGALDAHIGLGHTYRAHARYPQAGEHYRQALRLVQFPGQPGELDAVVGLGHVELFQDRHEQAARHYRRALRLATDVGNTVIMVAANNALGHTNRRLGRYPAAIRHHEQARELARSTGHLNGEADAYIGIGLVRLLQDRPDLAERAYLRVLERARQGLGPNYEFEAEQGLGRACLATGEVEAALAHHDRALALAVELNQVDDQARAHDGLAHVYLRLGRPDLARRHWEQALRLITQRGLSRTEDAGADVPTIRAHLAALDRGGAPGVAALSGSVVTRSGESTPGGGGAVPHGRPPAAGN